MNASIFIVTYSKDFNWLVFCLRSIEKFASGFSEVRILVPDEDLIALRYLVSKLHGESGIPIYCVSGNEWPGKGFLWHACQIFRADQWCEKADYVFHFDPDCIFSANVTPATFMVEDKPILRYEAFSTIGVRHPGVLLWKKAAEDCLPWEVDKEFMRGHPEVFHRGLYKAAREIISTCVGKPIDDYLKSCRNEFPQSAAEFPTLGAICYEKFRELYAPFNCGSQANPDFQPFPVRQCWSHAPIDKPQSIWWDGKIQKITPLEEFTKLGLV